MLNRGDAAILYSFVFLYFFVAGGGAWSLDRLWARESSAPAAAGSRA
jgi:putative oxidoreductase